MRGDGFWERCEYDERGRLRTRYSPFGNTSAADYRTGRAVTYDYAPWTAFGDHPDVLPLRARTITERSRQVVTARAYLIAAPGRTIEIRCAGKSSVPFDSPALCTTNRYYPDADANSTRLQSVEHPDGTMEIHSYGINPGSLTNIVLSGQPNSTHTDIVNGTKTLTVLGNIGQILLKEIYDIAPGRTNILTYREAYAYTDGLQRSHTVSYLDGTSNVVQYACCGLDSTIERDGLLTFYAYDALKRLKAETRFVGGSEAITGGYSYDPANRLSSTVSIGMGGTHTITRSGAAYDTAGRLLFKTNALRGVTACTYGFDTEGRAVVTRRYPNGGRQREAHNRDGSLHQVSGTAAHGVRYEYGVTEEGLLFTTEIKLTEAAAPTDERFTQYTDMLGREVKTEYADGAGTRSFYNEKGQLFKERNPDDVVTLYGYNSRGERDTIAVRTDASKKDDALDYAGTDRVTSTIRDVWFNPAFNANVERTRTWVWDDFQANTSNLVATVERSVDGRKTWRTVWSQGIGTTQRNEMDYTTNGYSHRYDYAPDGSYNLRRYRYGRLELLQSCDASGATNTQTAFRYEPHNRLWQEIELRNGATTYAYNNADQVTAVTAPAPGPEAAPRITRTHYNQMLQATNVVFPDKTSAFTEYHLTGEIKRTYGSRRYPVEYTVDYAGRVRSVKTWRRLAGHQHHRGDCLEL